MLGQVKEAVLKVKDAAIEGDKKVNKILDSKGFEEGITIIKAKVENGRAKKKLDKITTYNFYIIFVALILYIVSLGDVSDKVAWNFPLLSCGILLLTLIISFGFNIFSLFTGNKYGGRNILIFFIALFLFLGIGYLYLGMIYAP